MRADAASIILALAGTAVHGYTFAFYHNYLQGVIGGTDTTYKIFSTPPSCEDLGNAPAMGASNDVSSSRGVRCSGDGCTGIGGTGVIDQLEINWGQTHWTYYHDRGDGHLVDTNNNGVGLCHQPEPNELDCMIGAIGHMSARRVLRCETDGPVPDGLGN